MIQRFIELLKNAGWARLLLFFSIFSVNAIVVPRIQRIEDTWATWVVGTLAMVPGVLLALFLCFVWRRKR